MDAPLSNGNDGRDSQGRFTIGWKGGPGGNRFSQRQAQLREALQAAVTLEEVKAYGRKLFDLAMGGDHAAGKLWLLWCLGKPYDPDRVAGTEGAHSIEAGDTAVSDELEDLDPQMIRSMSPEEADDILEGLAGEAAGRYLKILLLHQRANGR